MENEGANIEFGEPIAEDDFQKESIEATFPVLKEALKEFYLLRSNQDEAASFAIQMLRDREIPVTAACGDLAMRKNSDVTLALSILESVRGALQLQRARVENIDSETAQGANVEKIREDIIEKDVHYQEAADVLYGAGDYNLIPERKEIIEWLAEQKKIIEKFAKEEEEKYKYVEPGEGTVRVFRSRLRVDVPAIERFELGKETTRDYNEVMSLVESRLMAAREHVGTFLLRYANDPKTDFRMEMAKGLPGVRRLELFLSQLEGERNERIARRF